MTETDPTILEHDLTLPPPDENAEDVTEDTPDEDDVLGNVDDEPAASPGVPQDIPEPEGDTQDDEATEEA